MSNSSRMSVTECLQPLVDLRQPDQVVITNHGSAREWPKLAQSDLDFHYIPSAMGGAIPFGLGLALAQPQRHVLVCSGDGSLLMNLGCLVTCAAAQPANLTIALLDNGVYEVTGLQKTAASQADVDFAGLARSAGFATVMEFSDAQQWRDASAAFLDSAGPRFVWLRIDPVTENFLLDPPCPISEQLDRLKAALDV